MKCRLSFQEITGYLSLSLISSAALLCFFAVFVSGWCSSAPPVCLSTFPLLLACLDASSALALAGFCEGFSPALCVLLPLACLTLTAPLLPPPEMVVLLRRFAGPLVSLISAALNYAVFTCLTLLATLLSPVSLRFHPQLYMKRCKNRSGLCSCPVPSLLLKIRHFITTTLLQLKVQCVRWGLPGLRFRMTSPYRAKSQPTSWIAVPQNLNLGFLSVSYLNVRIFLHHNKK